MQRKANWAKSAVNFIDGIARHLRHPLLSRMSGDASDGDASSLQMQEEQDIISLQSAPSQNFDSKEIDAG
jgi:hypothetical protein